MNLQKYSDFIEIESNISQELKNQVEALIGSSFKGLVPVAQSFGCSWKNRESNRENESKETQHQYLIELKDPNHHENEARSASYKWVKPLGFFLANEGKNRVDFFRHMKEEYLLVANVQAVTYPDANTIVIYDLSDDKESICFAVLNNEKIESLQHPKLAIPVLKAYGVEVREIWENEQISLSQVVDELKDKQNLDRYGWGKYSTSFEQLRKRAPKNNEVICSLDNIWLIESNWIYWAKIYCGLFLVSISVMILSFLPSFEVVSPFLISIGWGCFGFMFGLIFAKFLKGYKTRLKYTNLVNH